MKEVRFAEYRRYEARRVEASNAIMALAMPAPAWPRPRGEVPGDPARPGGSWAVNLLAGPPLGSPLKQCGSVPSHITAEGRA